MNDNNKFKVENFPPKTKEELKALLMDKDFTDKAMTVMTDKRTGETKSISLTKFIEVAGLDEAVEILFDNDTPAEAIEVNREKLQEIRNKAKRGEELTEKDEMVLMAAQAIIEDSPHVSDAEFFYSCIAAVAAKPGSTYKANGSLIGLLLNPLTYIASTGEKLSALADEDPDLLHEIGDKIGKDIMDSWEATLVEDHGITDDMVLLGLIHAIGNRFCNSSTKLGYDTFNIKKFVEYFNLDKEKDNDGGCEHCDTCIGCNCDQEEKSEEAIRNKLKYL